ncbi:MAG: CusA/CzcA family heavy metal efflux RND transporter [Chitinophagaceae bacterium]
MLNAIIHFSVRNKLVVGLFTLAWVIWGVVELLRLPVDALPDITSNQVQVITVSPTLGSMEVERLITFPIEQASSNIPGIKEIRSISRFGLSVVTIVFEDERDIYWCRQQVSERMTLIKDEIPKEAGTPELAPVTTGLGEIYQYVVRPKKGYENKFDLTELRTIQDWIVRRQLLGTPGVADVSSFGGKLKQYEVALDPVKLKSIGVTLQEVFNALEANNQNSGAAYIEKGPALLFIRTEGLAKSIDEIENIYVSRSAAGTPVYVKEVAAVRIGSPIRYGALTYKDQGEVSGAVVLMLKGENASKVIKGIDARMEQIKKTLPDGIEIETFLDRKKMVGRTLNTVQTNLLEGALIVLLILVLFLGNLRAGLIVASVIPLAMLFAVGMMNLFGVSGNLMSLGALDFGLIVDGAVIIVEAVLHRLHGNKHEGLMLRQHQMDQTVEQSAGRMMGAAVFGQIIILIVYIPILSLTGIEGKMFKPMAQTVAFALIGAFILSLTYVPMMTSLVLSKKLSGHDSFADKWMIRLQESFKGSLTRLILHPKKIIISALVLFSISIFVASRLGGEFIPELEEGDFAIDARLITGASLNETIESTQKAVAELQKFPEVEKVVTRIGASEIPTDPMPIEMTDIIVNLKDKKEWTSAESYDELANKMSAAIAKVPGLTGGFQYPVQMRFNELIAGAKQDVVCKIFGENLDTLANYAEKFSEIIKQVPGAKDVFAERVTGLPQIVIRYKKNAIAAYGLNISAINRVLRASFAGESAGKIYENERKFDLVVRLTGDRRNDLEDLRTLLVTNNEGVSIPLEQVADISIEDGPNQVQREDAKRRITVAFNVRDRDVQSVVEDVRNKAKIIQLPAGYYVTYGGQFENLVEAKGRLMIAVPIALFLILLILYFSFGSLRYGLLIYTAIPLSAIGGILLLWARGMPFSISAGIGFIALFGVAVLNGIVLINEFNRLKKETDMDISELVIKGTTTRLRPVLMTAAVASLGFLPMALSTSSGAEVQRPLATVVIGGLISATFLTLFVLPVLFAWVEKRKSTLNKTLTLFIIGLISSQIALSQQKKYVPIDSIVSLINSNALSIKISEKNTEAYQALRSKPAELPRTVAGIEYGNINSAFNDTRIFFNQGFQLPFVYQSQRKYYDQSIGLSIAQTSLTKAELNWKVRQICYAILDLDRREIILSELEKNFSEWSRIASVQKLQGEINASVLNAIKVQSSQQSLQKQLLNAEREGLISELNILLKNSDGTILPKADTLYFPSVQMRYDQLQSHALINVSDAIIAQQNALLKIEKNKLVPDFNLGYSNLSIIGWQSPDGISQKYYGSGARFGIYQFGMGLPIFNGAIKARIRSSKIGLEIAELNKIQKMDQLNAQYQRLLNVYKQQINTYNYYVSEGLIMADEMITQSALRFKNGDISFAEWALLVNQSLQIKISHADIIKSLQFSLAEFKYLTEKK